MTPASDTVVPAASLTRGRLTAAGGARVLAHPALDDIRLEHVLHALSDPIRLRIVRQMAVASAGLACSYFELPVAKSTLTHHFRVLRESGVIHQIYRGTAKLNELRADDLEKLFPGLLDSVLRAAGEEAARLPGPRPAR